MPNLTPQEKIALFKHLFRGREDVFAVYWEKADKSVSGYTPACLNEWKAGLCCKMQKKKCKDCSNARYSQLDDYCIEQHLRGQKLYGIYPLLESNESYFIVADFDGDDWEKDVWKFYKKCEELKISAYIERSKSGKGGHVWIFFEDKYPAFKSRNIITNILQEAKIVDQFDKEDSFDRLFPNQDTLSGKGFGNLIALPLQGKFRENGNTIFLDPTNKLIPYADQWELLQSIKKITTDQLDGLYNNFNEKIDSIEIKTSTKSGKQLMLTIAEQIYISKINLPRVLINFLREELNFVNADFLIKKKIGLNTHKIERYFKLIESVDNYYAIPRGFLTDLINFLNEKNIKFEINDQRKKYDQIDFSNSCQLYDYQLEAVENIILEDRGILVAPPGSGKTVMAMEIIARLKQPTLILVHNRQIFNQWVEKIENFLGISKKDIGQISGVKKIFGKKITIAMMQTLSGSENIKEDFKLDNIGLLLVDECHHIPAKTFRKIITKLNPYYSYGLTATPKRKYNDEKLIYIYLGKILHEIDKNYNTSKEVDNIEKNNSKIIIKNTELDLPFKIKMNNFSVLSKILVCDSNRNSLIVNDIISEVDKGNKCLVLTERKEHVEILNYYLNSNYEIISLTGDLTEKQKKEKIKQIESKNFQIIIATGQLIGEGTDFINLDCLFLVYPFSFEGKLTQYIGRIQRGENSQKTIYDYRDINISYLEKFFKKRKKYYEKYLKF